MPWPTESGCARRPLSSTFRSGKSFRGHQADSHCKPLSMSQRTRKGYLPSALQRRCSLVSHVASFSRSQRDKLSLFLPPVRSR